MNQPLQYQKLACTIFTQYPAFIEAYDTNSLNLAAENLNVTPPRCFSSDTASLEQYLGKKLFRAAVKASY